MSNQPTSAKVHRWLAEPVTTDIARSIERLTSAEDVQHVAVMPDVHLAREVCVGTVLATTNLIYPAAIGGDIGCGMAAVRFDANADLLADERTAAKLLAGLYRYIPSNKHPTATMPVALPEDLEAVKLSDPQLDRMKQRDGRVQLGTLGGGNHFLEFQADEDDQLWLMVHTGSRAMGQAIAEHHLKRAGRSSGQLLHLAADTVVGQAYLHDAGWATRYAMHNRGAIVTAASQLMLDLFGITTDEATLIQCDHNHVRCETHFGQSYWIHRKGAQSARPDEPGMVPGSMGTTSFHTAGRGCAEALSSCSHGAGRRLSRSEARRTITSAKLQRQMQSVWFDHRRAHALRDEAPKAYKDIHKVMRAQKELARIVRTLRPLLSYKGA